MGREGGVAGAASLLLKFIINYLFCLLIFKFASIRGYISTFFPSMPHHAHFLYRKKNIFSLILGWVGTRHFLLVCIPKPLPTPNKIDPSNES